jgi:hypothetical protein
VRKRWLQRGGEQPCNGVNGMRRSRSWLEGLKGRPVAELNEYQLAQSPYYRWRDECLGNAAKVFELHQQTAQVARLVREHTRLERLVGELAWERKKSDEVCG